MMMPNCQFVAIKTLCEYSVSMRSTNSSSCNLPSHRPDITEYIVS